MAEILSKNIEDLFSSKTKKYISTDMIDDIKYFILNSNSNKAELTYEDKVLRMIKTECCGTKLYLEIEGKVMDIIP